MSRHQDLDCQVASITDSSAVDGTLYRHPNSQHCMFAFNCYAGTSGSAAGKAEVASAQQEADVALAYAQLATLAHERRGPK